MPDHLKKLAADCDVILEKLRDPDAFSALNASQGFEGFYPPTGLYSEADWPTRFSGLDA